MIYDRAGSAFAEAPPDFWDWDQLLAGVTRLHMSGVTAALGPGPAASAVAAAEAAAARGIPLSFDGNWRGKLWALWDGVPRIILSRIVAHADILFGDARDIALLTGRRAPFADPRHAAEIAFADFPKLDWIACTSRRVKHVDHHLLSARIDTRTEEAVLPSLSLAGIVDRIGDGDAFAAGVLHARMRGEAPGAAARFALALTALKHSLPGDASLFSEADVDTVLRGGLDVRR